MEMDQRTLASPWPASQVGSTSELCLRPDGDRRVRAAHFALDPSADSSQMPPLNARPCAPILSRSTRPAPPASGLTVAEHLVDQLLVFSTPLGRFVGRVPSLMRRHVARG